MPPVDHLSSRGTLNVLLDRDFSGIPAGLPPDRTMIGLFMNFSRLTDKALWEYDAARAELLLYVSPHDGPLRITPYLRAIDHMENCVSAAHRAVLNAQALQANKIGRSAPRLTPRQEERLTFLRNGIEHSDEKLLGKQHGKSPAFDKAASASGRTRPRRARSGPSTSSRRTRSAYPSAAPPPRSPRSPAPAARASPPRAARPARGPARAPEATATSRRSNRAP
jgi:hypothetical protein